jgi:hypothetical protein
VALALGAGAIWQVSQSPNRVETAGVDDDGPSLDDDDEQSLDDQEGDVPKGDQDQEAPVESVAEETEWNMLQRLVDELPLDQRIPDSPYDENGDERFDYQWTAEGLWVYSSPDPTEVGPTSEVGEILLLEDWGGPIIDSWLLGYFPGRYRGQIEISDDAVYCISLGDGGLPDSLTCRIERSAGEVTMAIYPAPFDGGSEESYSDLFADTEIDWRLVPQDQADGFAPFGWLYVEEGDAANGSGPSLVDESRLVRLDPDTLEPTATTDLAASGQRIFPCPFRDQGAPELDATGIPPAVQATRQAIVDAAARCDVDALEALSGGQLTVPRADGGWGMVTLAFLLTIPPDVVEGGVEEDGQNVYLFPSEADALSRGERDAVSRLYGPDGDDHLTIILEDGTWLPVSP